MTFKYAMGDEEMPMIRISDPRIQYFQQAMTTKRIEYSGFLIAKGQDEDLDDFMSNLGWEAATIQHSGGPVEHWLVKRPRFFVVARAVRSIGELGRNVQKNEGISYGWVTDERSGRQFSRCRARVFLQDLLENGWDRPLLLTTRKLFAVELMNCFVKHVDMFKARNALRERGGKPENAVPFYAISMELKAGDALVPHGKTPGQQKQVFPITLNAPKDPLNNLDAAGEYILDHWLDSRFIETVEEYVPETIRWSKQEITSNETSDEEGEAPAPPQRPQQGTGRRFIGDDAL